MPALAAAAPDLHADAEGDPVKFLLPVPGRAAEVEVLVWEDGEVEVGAGWWLGEYRDRMAGFELDKVIATWPGFEEDARAAATRSAP